MSSISLMALCTVHKTSLQYKLNVVYSLTGVGAGDADS